MTDRERERERERDATMPQILHSFRSGNVLNLVPNARKFSPHGHTSDTGPRVQGGSCRHIQGYVPAVHADAFKPCDVIVETLPAGSR